MISIKTPEEIEKMREAAKILVYVMKKIEKLVQPGVTTKYLNEEAEKLILKLGAKSNFKNYNGFPAVLCTCINEEVVHCPPSERKLKEGDIITLDGGVLFNGFHSDMAVTLPVGEVSQEAQRLIRVAKKALKRGIKKVKPGRTFGDIGNTIQRYVEKQGYSIVRELCGHGIGKELHEDPQIPNFGKRRSGPKIETGMVFCLEPIISAGDWRIKKTKDGFGYQTKDGSLSAHFEHMIAVTDRGVEVLTR